MNNKTSFDLLKDELSHAAILLDILNQEQAALADLRFEKLQEVSEQKERALDGFTALTVQRHQLMTINGFELTLEGVQKWLESLAANAQATMTDLESTWAHLLVTTREAKEQNRINGLLITKHASGVQRTLHAIRGSATDAGTYGPNGHASNYTAPRTLVIG